ncbi:hypothetical protein ACFQWH_00035 [Mycolicibacterium sp. GCM10028919]|uniref:hypothetical protein n=1 Tax=Mycolicibacterium sp. GCM10028919 TaxID=3273401 RepID=UPI003610128E
MTLQTSSSTGWRRAATGVVASGLVVGMLATAPSALSEPAPVDPANPATPAAAAPGSPIRPGGAEAPAPESGAMTAEEALAIIQTDYDLGAGGGQLSKLIHSVLKLRSQGFYPSKGNVIAIEDALGKRPNQAPLITALEQTLAFQRRTQQRGMAQQEAPSQIGIGQMPPGSNGPVPGDNDDDGNGISLVPFG